MLQAQTHQTAKTFKLHAKIHAWSPHENPMPTRSFLLSRQILAKLLVVGHLEVAADSDPKRGAGKHLTVGQCGGDF